MLLVSCSPCKSCANAFLTKTVLYCAEVGGQGLDTHLLNRNQVYCACIEIAELPSREMDSPLPFFPEDNAYRLAKLSIGKLYVCFLVLKYPCYLGAECLLSVDSSGYYAVSGDCDSGTAHDGCVLIASFLGRFVSK